MNDLLAWAEENGLENLRSHIESASIIAREASATLGWLATVAGACLAFIANSNWSPVSVFAKVGLCVLAVYLLILCAVLILRCLRITDYPVPTNEPMHLVSTQFTLDQMRAKELENIQDRIRQTCNLNIATSNALNRVRIFAVAGLAFAGLVALGAVVHFAFAAPVAESQALETEQAGSE